MLQRHHGCSERLNIFFLHASDNLYKLGEFPRTVLPCGSAKRPVFPSLLKGYHADLHHYGAWLVFALVFLESLGLPLPGEAILVSAAIFAGTTQNISIALVLLAAVAGAIIGSLGFVLWVGAYYFGKGVEEFARPFAIALAVVGAIVVVFMIVYWRRKEQELAAAAERDIPGRVNLSGSVFPPVPPATLI
jgi:membrane protein DedA with SNARE-associated domain